MMKWEKGLVLIPSLNVELEGEVKVPKNAKGIVLFAHGSGSSRSSVRNNYVAEVLRKEGLATLLFDLLTEDEAIDRRNVFNIDLLAERLVTATEWVSRQKSLKDLRRGYFGASTGAAAAILASVLSESEIKAIVSRGGRPDLTMPILNKVKAPTMLIVGGDDIDVLRLNQLAFNELRVEKKLEIVPGATHLFEEPGKLESVAKLATGWFLKHLQEEA
jgi:dienelactone hydrolase